MKGFRQFQTLEQITFQSDYTALPDTFDQNRALKYLRIKNRLLTALPKSLCELRALEHMEILMGKLEAIPKKTFSQLGALKHLKIFSYCITTLPTSLGELRTLEHLDISLPRLNTLPETLSQLGALKRLRINCRDLRALPNTLEGLRGLQHLIIRGCEGLTALPDAFGNFEHLERLEIESCGISAIPESIGKLRALRILQIRGCTDLKAMPDALLELEDLEHLVIKYCPHLERGAERFMFEGSMTIVLWRLITLHRKAMEKVRGSEYEGALADLNSWNLEGLEPQYQGFFLQERGITKRLVGDLHGALQDLTAALKVFSKADDRSPYTYNCWKHRGFVKFLLEDLDGARKDGTMALKLCSLQFPQILMLPSLGNELVTFMHFRLKGTKGITKDRIQWEKAHPQILEKVRTSQFRDALAMCDALDAEVSGYHDRFYFLQQRGIMKRFAGDLHGALEDLTSALEINDDDYECYKHRSYANFLLGNTTGARTDAKKCLALHREELSGDRGTMALHYKVLRDDGLGRGPVAFLDFDLS